MFLLNRVTVSSILKLAKWIRKLPVDRHITNLVNLLSPDKFIKNMSFCNTTDFKRKKLLINQIETWIPFNHYLMQHLGFKAALCKSRQSVRTIWTSAL